LQAPSSSFLFLLDLLFLFILMALRPVFEPWPPDCRGFEAIEFLLQEDVSLEGQAIFIRHVWF
jgi:hypothetical protein